jgi:hypothetical protein
MIGRHFETNSVVERRNSVRTVAARFLVENASLRHLECSSPIVPVIYPTVAGETSMGAQTATCTQPSEVAIG